VDGAGLPVGAQSAGDGEAVQPRYGQVQQDAARRGGPGEVKGAGPVLGLGTGETALLQQVAQQGAGGGVIVGDQDVSTEGAFAGPGGQGDGGRDRGSRFRRGEEGVCQA
jgi:hypothetical protein